MFSVDATRWFSITSGWPAVAAGAVPLAGAALTRVVPVDHRPLSRVLPDLGFALLLGLSLLTFGERGPATAALTLVVAYPFVVVPARRRASMEWLGWLASAAVAILVADIAGQPTDDLHLVLIAWGAVALLGALGLDELLAGPRLPGEWTRRRFLTPGVVLGPIALSAGLAPSFLDGSTAYGWWSLAVAAVVAVAAAQLRSGVWTVVSWTLASVSYAALGSLGTDGPPVDVVAVDRRPPRGRRDGNPAAATGIRRAHPGLVGALGSPAVRGRPRHRRAGAGDLASRSAGSRPPGDWPARHRSRSVPGCAVPCGSWWVRVWW